MTTPAQTAPLVVRASGRTAAASPLRYPGGKAALAGLFGELIARLRIESACYVEPYAGGAGAGIALLKQDAVQELVINDIDPAVYCFWLAVTRQPDEFTAKISDTPLNVEEWRRQKQIYRDADESNPLALGFAFFYLNRTNRSGILNAGPIGGVRQEGNYKIDARFNRDQLAERVASIGALAARITVLSRDGMSIVRQHVDDASTFTYIDPPYVEMGGSLYLNAFTHRDHSDLAQVLDRQPNGNWVVTYDPSDLIRQLYRRHDVREYQLSYSAHRTGKTHELFVASRPISRHLPPVQPAAILPGRRATSRRSRSGSA
jgi:DNA adenine methylase